METVLRVGLLSVDLHIPMSRSLKTKRRVLKSLKDRTRHRFNVSIAEIGAFDKWQRALIGICMIGNDKAYIESNFQSILAVIEDVKDSELLNRQIEFI